MSLPNNVVNLGDRSELETAAANLARNALDIDNYEAVLGAVGKIFTQTFGYPCVAQLVLTNQDKAALVKSLEQKQ